jgi:hypothetical protein
MKIKTRRIIFPLAFILPAVLAFGQAVPPVGASVVAGNPQAQAAPLCSAGGHEGATVAEAIRNCFSSNQIQSICAQNVACPAAVAICRASGYAGDSVDAAVRECVADGHMSSSFCSLAGSVVCSAAAPSCQSLSYMGSTIQSAVQQCILAGFSRGQCAKDVSCSAEVSYCKAAGYAGDSVQDSINQCRSNGGLNCDKNVDCVGTPTP